MYNLADFRKDWRWMLVTSVVGFIAVGVLLLVFEDYDLFHELRWDRDSLAEASAFASASAWSMAVFSSLIVVSRSAMAILLS